MYNFCTLFDSNYLHKGLALYLSLESTNIEFQLYVLAFDDYSYDKLKKIKFQNLSIISLSEFENPKLLNVKPSRNRAEYCWTCGPSLVHYCLSEFNLDHCTYLDADLMFFDSPKPIFDEIGENSIALSEHFTEKIDKLAGQFCVQFVYFKNDLNGMQALNWWKDSCINWCYARYEDGKYGDQKYLDYFPDKFQSVYIIKNRGAGVAPWNIKEYTIIDSSSIKYKNISFNIIFYHFHGTKFIIEDQNLTLSPITYDINSREIEYIYKPYLLLMKYVFNNLLDSPIISLKFGKRTIFSKLISKLKLMFKKYKLIQKIYFRVLKFKYNGYENH